MKEGINWKQTLITAFITVLVTVIAGMLLFYFQTKKVKLSYEISQITPFHKQNEELTIYHVSLSNSGKDIAEEVKGIIDIRPARIDEYNITTDFPLQKNDSLNNGVLYFSLRSLNSDEKVSISILANSSSSFPESPNIKIRAKGCLATLNTNQSKINEQIAKPNLMILILMGIFASFVSSITISKSRGIISIFQAGRHTGAKQQEVFAYLFENEGLEDMSSEYRKINYEISYWSESDRLTFLSQSENPDFILKIINVFLNLFDYAGPIATESKAVIHYNISKLYGKLNNPQEQDKYLKLALKSDKELINLRLKIENKS